VRELRRLGYDVLTIQETGRHNQGTHDLENLAFASADGRAVLTMDEEYKQRWHKEWPNHQGIILCSHEKDFKAQASHIHKTISPKQSLAGQLIEVYHPESKRARLKVTEKTDEVEKSLGVRQRLAREARKRGPSDMGNERRKEDRDHERER